LSATQKPDRCSRLQFGIARIFQITHDAKLDPWSGPLTIPSPIGDFTLTHQPDPRPEWNPALYEFTSADEFDVGGKYVTERITRFGNLLFGFTLLRNAAIVFNARCISGIKANRERCLAYVQNSIGLVTALNPVLGYEKSAAIAKEALLTNRSVYELVLEKNLLTQTQLDDILKPETMTHPRQLASRI
jgi:Fumarase C C-terminus